MLDLIEVEREAVPLRNDWIVRPKGQLGTCGFHPVPWTAQRISFRKAKTAEQAVQKTQKIYMVPKEQNG